jgi:hypothetical protein
MPIPTALWPVQINDATAEFYEESTECINDVTAALEAEDGRAGLQAIMEFHSAQLVRMRGGDRMILEGVDITDTEIAHSESVLAQGNKLLEEFARTGKFP